MDLWHRQKTDSQLLINIRFSAEQFSVEMNDVWNALSSYNFAQCDPTKRLSSDGEVRRRSGTSTAISFAECLRQLRTLLSRMPNLAARTRFSMLPPALASRH